MFRFEGNKKGPLGGLFMRQLRESGSGPSRVWRVTYYDKPRAHCASPPETARFLPEAAGPVKQIRASASKVEHCVNGLLRLLRRRPGEFGQLVANEGELALGILAGLRLRLRDRLSKAQLAAQIGAQA